MATPSAVAVIRLAPPNLCPCHRPSRSWYRTPQPSMRPVNAVKIRAPPAPPLDTTGCSLYPLGVPKTHLGGGGQTAASRTTVETTRSCWKRLCWGPGRRATTGWGMDGMCTVDSFQVGCSESGAALRLLPGLFLLSGLQAGYMSSRRGVVQLGCGGWTNNLRTTGGGGGSAGAARRSGGGSGTTVGL